MSQIDTLTAMFKELCYARDKLDSPVQDRIDAVHQCLQMLGGAQPAVRTTIRKTNTSAILHHCLERVGGNAESNRTMTRRVGHNLSYEYGGATWGGLNRQEGWHLAWFDVGENVHQYQIQTYGTRYSDDVDAVEHVISQALTGSLRHILALYLHGTRLS